MFGIAIFWTLRLSNSAITTDMIETIAAVRNMRLYDSIDGKNRAIPPIVNMTWLDCIYIPASAGPIEAPTILIRLLIPSDIPLDCLGV